MSEREMSVAERKHARGAIETTIASVIHQLAGHVTDHEGDVGGCHRAAAAIVSMFPADVVGAREDLADLEERAQLVVAERDAAMAEVDRLNVLLASASKATANYGATGTATLAEVKSDVE